MNDFGEEDDFNNNSDQRAAHAGDYLIDQRATDRLMLEISSTGYRDGYQGQFEDEKLMQIGFDVAFKQLARLGFLVGQIRSLAAHSSAFSRDTAFLARLNEKLERIEKNAYESLLDWRQGEDASTGLSDQRLSGVVSAHQSRLASFRDHLRQVSSALGKAPRPLAETTMSDLDAIQTTPEDDSNEPAANLDSLNTLLDSWNL